IGRRHHLFPLVADLVQIRMADPAIENFDFHVLRTWRAPLQRERRETRGLALRRIRFRGVRLYFRWSFFLPRRLLSCFCHVYIPPWSRGSPLGNFAAVLDEAAMQWVTPEIVPHSQCPSQPKY